MVTCGDLCRSHHFLIVVAADVRRADFHRAVALGQPADALTANVRTARMKSNVLMRTLDAFYRMAGTTKKVSCRTAPARVREWENFIDSPRQNLSASIAAAQPRPAAVMA